MGNRAASEELNEENGLFTKSGVPVKFCFHSSVRQGRARLTEDIERHGGRIVADERETNVLLVDEEADIALMRRRYYSSPELYRMSIFVEPRGFVRHCITTGYYGHLGPPRQKMPGPERGANAGRARVPFTSEDKQHLAHYLSTIFPTRDGRLGMKAYKDMEQLGQFDEYAWVRRHTAHSWREHYKKNPEEMDRWIGFYARHLEGQGHQLGQDRRTRNLQALRQEEEEEEEVEGEEEEEQPQPQPQRRRRERADQDVAPRQQSVEVNAAAREYLAQREQDLVAFEGGEEAPPEEDAASREPQQAKRQHPDAQALHAKRARVAKAPSRQNSRPPAVEQGRGESQAPGDGAKKEESPELEGSDLFGDREYVQEPVYDYNGVPDMDLPRPPSPEAGSIADEEGPPAPTQATLIASPDASEKHISSQSSRAAEELVLQPTAPPSSQVTLVMTQERVATRHVRGAPVQPARAQPRSLVGEAPYRNTRSRSRSVEPQPAAPRRREVKGKGKAKANELVPILEVEQVEATTAQDTENTAQATSSAPSATNNGLSSREAFEDEMAVEGLLEATNASRLESDEDSDDDDDTLPPLPPFQDIEVNDLDSGPSDSDDAETHHVLKHAAKNGSPKDDEDNASEEDDDKNRINRTTDRSLTQPTPPSEPKPASRVTRSMAQQAARGSARKTGSNSMTQVRDREPQFPNPGTKARAAVDRVNEAKRNLSYAPPAGSQAAKALGRRG